METQTEGSKKEDEAAQGGEKNEPSKSSEDLKKDSETENKEKQDNTNFGIVTDEDREADREALGKLTNMIEERLKANPLPPPPAQATADGSWVSNSESAKTRDGDANVNITKSGEVLLGVLCSLVSSFLEE